MITNKSIIIVDESMPTGIKANICAILGMSLGKKHPEIVGVDISTSDQKFIPGITQIPLPVLQSSSRNLLQIFTEHQDTDISIIVFDESALVTKNYSDFQIKMSSTAFHDLRIHGLLAYGHKKIINKISADLSLLK